MCIKKRMIISLLFAIILIIIVISCCEKERICSFQGLVYDSSSDLPINEVLVKVIDGDEHVDLNSSSTFTNEEGYFILEGIFKLSKYADYLPSIDCEFYKDGYKKINVEISPLSTKEYYLDIN